MWVMKRVETLGYHQFVALRPTEFLKCFGAEARNAGGKSGRN